MVAPIYSNRKGIYKDLYKEIDSDNKKKEASQIKKRPKGIYIEMYKQIGFKNNDGKTNKNDLYILAFKKFIKDILSRTSRFFSVATSDIKMLIIACMIVKTPINNYIEKNWDIQKSSTQ